MRKLPFFSPRPTPNRLGIFWTDGVPRAALLFPDGTIGDIRDLSFGRRRVPLLKRARRNTVLFPSNSGFLDDQRLVWNRDRPQDPITVSEMRAVIHEIETRGKETLRRNGWTDRIFSTPPVFRSVRLDGKRVVSPLGFSGRSLVVYSTQTFLFPPAEAFFKKSREQYRESQTDIFLVDDLLASLLGAFSPSVLIVLEEESTVAARFEGELRVKREVISLGQGSIWRRFMRTFKISSPKEAQRLLAEAARGGIPSSLRRRIETALAPTLFAWSSVVEEAILPRARYGKSKTELRLRGENEAPVGNVVIVSTAPFSTPFQRALTPKVLARIFPHFHDAAFRAFALHELLNLSWEASVEELLFCALARGTGAPTSFEVY